MFKKTLKCFGKPLNNFTEEKVSTKISELEIYWLHVTNDPLCRAMLPYV